MRAPPPAVGHAGGVPLSFPILPMRAVSGELPPSQDDARWAYEVKWDGMRVVAWIGADRSVRLQSARPNEVTTTFPELAGLGGATGGRAAVLDGEVVAIDESGRPSFGRLQHRMHVVEPAKVAARAAAVPVAFQVFDLLAFDGHEAVGLPYLDRRRLLAEVVEPGPSWAVPAHHLDDGHRLLESVRALGLEGLVAKRRDSTYQLGRRSPAWRKIKVRLHQEFVVVGWSPGEGRRRGALAALALAARDGDRLVYTGKVGTGFNDAELARLRALLAPLERPDPPMGAVPAELRRQIVHWVEPTVVVEVAFGEWTGDRLLRHPSYLGQRTDKDPRSVTRDP